MSNNAFEAVMLHIDSPNDDNKKLSFSLSRVIGNVLRLFVAELTPLRRRFQINDIMSDEARHALPFSDITHDETGSLLKWNGKYECFIQYRPFQIVIKNDGAPEMVVNEFESFYFEQYRVRKSYDGCEGDECPSESEAEKELWEERHSSHTYHHDDGPASIGLDFTFVGNRFVYGIPEHASSLALHNTVGPEAKYSEPYRLWNLDVFEYKLDVPDALYGAIPYVVSYSQSNANAVLWMNAAETYVDIGDSDAMKGKNVRWMSESGAMEAFVLMHDHSVDGDQYLSQYHKITGQPQLPPISALGHHQCRWNYNDVDDVRGISDQFDELDIPNDFIWLDIEHTDGKRYFTWDKHKFSGAREMIDYVSSSGRKMVTIVDPHIKKDKNYYVYSEIDALDLWTKNRDGESYTGWCWPGDSRYPDFANKEMRLFWSQQFQFDKYVESTKDLFIWNDMNEPSIFNGPEVSMPISNIHHYYGQEVRHSELHNLYGFYVHEATFDGLLLRSDNKLRPFVLSRSFFAGSQKYGAIWTGDNTANWEHLKISVPMLLELSIAGLPFVGADVGGFFNNPDGELMARWYELGCWYPFFRNHAHQDTKRRELWVFDDDHAQRMKNAILARYRILPYVYTLFYLSSQQSQLIMRPLWFGPFRGDESAYNRDDAFMFGPAFYIQPIVEEGVGEIDVHLPENDGGNALFYEVNGNVMNIYRSGEHRLSGYENRIPVLRYGGTITAEKHRIRRSASLMKYDPITIVVALDAGWRAEGDYYGDDEESLNGEYILTKLHFAENTLKNEIKMQSDERSSIPELEVERIVIMGEGIHDKQFKEIAIEQLGASRSTRQFGTAPHTLVVRLPGVLINQEFSITLT